MNAEPKSVLDRLEQAIRDEDEHALRVLFRNHAADLIAVARAAQQINHEIWTPTAPDSETYYQSTVALRDALALLTRDSDA